MVCHQLTDCVGIRLLILYGICFVLKSTTACDDWSWDEKYERGCSTPTVPAGLWMCKNGEVGCYDCDVGERWDPVQETCQKCGGSLTSCKKNISPSACYKSECESKATAATEIFDPTPTPTDNEATTSPDSTILTTLSALRTSGAFTKAIQPAETTRSSSDNDDRDGDDNNYGDDDDDNDHDDYVKSTTGEYIPSIAIQSDNTAIIIGLSFVLAVALCVIGVFLLYYCRQRSPPAFSPIIPESEGRSRPQRNRRFDDDPQNVV